jgi:hypothetical protein
MKEHEENFRELYEKRTGKRLTDEEAIEAAENLVRYIEILAHWDAEKKSKPSSKEKEKPR